MLPMADIIIRIDPCFCMLKMSLYLWLCSNDDPDAWSLIGNLHLAKMEWGPAQVTFPLYSGIIGA
jgi:hypothetical protein